MGQDLSPLVVPGAVIAFQIAWGDRPVVTAMYEAGALPIQLGLVELANGIAQEERDDPGVHGHMQQKALVLIQGNADPEDGDWVASAGATLLWCGLHHPGLGEWNVGRAARLLASKGRATMAFEVRDGGLWFEVFDLPLPRGGALLSIEGPRPQA